MNTQRMGDWMQTATGRLFYPLDPLPSEIAIEDIAHALSLMCRFGGHCRTFYSVAQHSVLVSLECASKDALSGLLHDAAEAYVGDMVRPLKREKTMREYIMVEVGILEVVAERFGLPQVIPDSVKRADEVLLATEARDLMGHDADKTWCLRYPPSENGITPWGHEESERAFLARFDELGGRR